MNSVSARLLLLFAVLAMVGCSREVIRYAPVPSELVPPAPKYERVEPDDVMCLSDSAYERLARNFLACKRYGAELRALLGAP